MIITKNEQFCKLAKIPRLKTSHQEGRHILYLLRDSGYLLSTVSRKLKCSLTFVHYVVYGRRRSRKVEAEIARLLGKESWNDVVIEARLAVSNPAYRPTAEDIEAYKDTIRTKLQQVEERKAQIRKELAPMREAIASIKGRRRG